MSRTVKPTPPPAPVPFSNADRNAFQLISELNTLLSDDRHPDKLFNVLSRIDVTFTNDFLAAMTAGGYKVVLTAMLKTLKLGFIID